MSNPLDRCNTVLEGGLLKFKLKVPPTKTRCIWAQGQASQQTWWDNYSHNAMSQTSVSELDKGRQRKTSFINSKTLRTVLSLFSAHSPRNLRFVSSDVSSSRNSCFWLITTSSLEWYHLTRWHFQSEDKIRDWWWWSQTSACIQSLTFRLSTSIPTMFLCLADRAILPKASQSSTNSWRITSRWRSKCKLLQIVSIFSVSKWPSPTK